MKRIFFLLIILTIISISGISQQDTVYATKAEFNSEIRNLNNTITNLRNQIRNASSRNRTLNESMIDLSRKNDSLGMALYYTRNETDMLIDSLELSINKITRIEEDNRSKLEEVLSKIDKAYLYFIGAIIIIVLFGLILFLVLRNNILRKTNKDYREKLNQLIKENNQTKKMVLLHELMSNMPLKEKAATAKKSDDEPFTWMADGDETGRNHSLAMKIGAEILSIKSKLDKLDEKTPGLKELKKMIQKLENELLECGYVFEENEIKYKD